MTQRHRDMNGNKTETKTQTASSTEKGRQAERPRQAGRERHIWTGRQTERLAIR